MEIKRPKPKQTIPQDAQTVFDGIIFDVIHWQQELFDGSKTTFEVLKRDDTVLVIPVTTDKRIIVLEQEQPGKAAFTGMPGGRVDEGEDPLAAAQRELAEETGYTAADWQLWDAFQPLSKLDWAIYIFIARDAEQKSEQTLDKGERICVEDYSFEEFLQLTHSESFADIEISLKTMRASLQGKQDILRKEILGD